LAGGFECVFANFCEFGFVLLREAFVLWMPCVAWGEVMFALCGGRVAPSQKKKDATGLGVAGSVLKGVLGGCNIFIPLFA
jgi:hypothetical protein